LSLRPLGLGEEEFIMDLMEAIGKRRSIRRFSPEPLNNYDLYEMVQAARLAPQAANIQPIRYCLVHQQPLLGPVFECTKWAGYFENYAPPEGHRPQGYVVILVDEKLKGRWTDTDVGAAVENMLLTATSKGLGACWIGSVDRDRVRHILGIPEEFSIHSIVAVGHPAQESVWEEKNSESIKYYLDDENKLHVPKRRMGEILVPITPHID